MLKSTVISILRSFAKEEIIKFDDFLKSPYFNKKSAVPLLFGVIRKHYPELSSPELEKEKLWGKLYPGKEYNYGMMKNLIHELTKLAEQFITQEEYRQNEIQEFANLYMGLTRRLQYDIIENKDSYLAKKFNDSEIIVSELNTEEYYHQLVKIHRLKMWNKHFYNPKLTFAKERYETEDILLAGILPHLFTVRSTAVGFSISDKESIETKSSNEIIINCLSESVIEELYECIMNRSPYKAVLIKCYFLAFKAISNLSDPRFYYSFKEFALNNFNLFNKSTIRDMDAYLVNVVNSITDKAFDKNAEFYDIFFFKQKNNMVLDVTGLINSSQFYLWLYIFFEENRSDDIVSFVENYGKHLAGDERTDILKLSEAMINFLDNEFDKSISAISRMKFNTFRLKNALKCFEMMNYFETNDYESFLYLFDAHKHFLSYSHPAKEGWSEYIANRSKQFCTSLNKLFKIKEEQNNADLKLFRDDITVMSIDHKKWFLRKIDELKNFSR